MSNKVYTDFLQQENFKFTEESYGISFKYKGGNFFISNPGEDKLYFSLVMPGLYDVESSSDKAQILEILNNMTSNLKVVKAYLVEDSVWLSTEMFIDSDPKLDDFFFRLLNMLSSAQSKFFELRKEL